MRTESGPYGGGSQWGSHLPLQAERWSALTAVAVVSVRRVVGVRDEWSVDGEWSVGCGRRVPAQLHAPLRRPDRY